MGEVYRSPQTISIGSAAGRLTVIGPKNEPVAFATSGDPEHVTVDVQQTALPGFYRFKIGDQTVGQAAPLNVDPRESNLERIDRETLLHSFNATGSQPAVESGRMGAARQPPRPVAVGLVPGHDNAPLELNCSCWDTGRG